ncbi:exonuclease SbcCD subunit D [Acinetobacter sp. HY1485]|uniref:exonuclease SbcCD subunit D n=1 Tax=Acinetobacter sp. HY1485 TaxID=2970918 RepID=UPI0022B9C337|nr:exonuclease SbcCD subunit D [Acinetobacter sp. HY1485]
MSVHFIHTSDWHLGQLFYNHARDYEHQQFLAWLLEKIKEKQPHALLISGDIFDVINPASSAQKQLYQFLADAHALAPHMQTLMIAGNHDSGYRIEQVEPLLEKYNAKTVGVIRWNEDRTLNTDHLIIPIYKQEQIVAWCVALPFLRPAEITGRQDPSSAIEYIHHTLIEEAKRRKTADQAIIVMSHAHMQGGEESDSERPIIVGHQEALSTDLFGTDVDYVALGHLHKPQKVQETHIRYSGSPIPLSFSEVNYKHQVVEVKLGASPSFEPLFVPRTVELLPFKDSLEIVMQQLKALAHQEKPLEQRPYIDIEYTSDVPPPLDLRQQIEQALPTNSYRLVRICRKYQASTTDTTISKIDLEPPTPQALFEQLWEKQGYTPDDAVIQDFLTLLHDAQQ